MFKPTKNSWQGKYLARLKMTECMVPLLLTVTPPPPTTISLKSKKNQTVPPFMAPHFTSENLYHFEALQC